MQFEITALTRQAVESWLIKAYLRNDNYLFLAVCTIPRILQRDNMREFFTFGTNIGLNASAYGTHSLRRTKASLIYKRTKSLHAVQIFLGHTKLESMVHYLGIDVDYALEISEQTEI